jgi:hypothetical protein
MTNALFGFNFCASRIIHFKLDNTNIVRNTHLNDTKLRFVGFFGEFLKKCWVFEKQPG